MRVLRKYFLYTFVLFAQFCLNSTESLRFRDDRRKMVEAIQKYFPHENSLCVVLAESGSEKFWPNFHVPVVVFTQAQVLQDCGKKLTEQDDGYIFMTSNTSILEEQIVPLLKCFNQTTLKLKTKYMLVLDLSKDSNSLHSNNYSYFFHSLWNVFGIINIAILPVQDRWLNTDPSTIFSYNPFLPSHHSRALRKNTLTQDVRSIMIDRFRNMHGHRLKTVFYSHPVNFLTLKDFNKKETLGANLVILSKQILETKLNVSFDIYERAIILNTEQEPFVTEIGSGKADFCINFFLLPHGNLWIKTVQPLIGGCSFDLVFVVPMPKQVESWRFFQYIFERRACVGLGIVLFGLSCAALLFDRVRSETNTSSHSSSRSSEVVAVWKAVLSVPVNRLPTTHSQRCLIAWSLLFGLIFLTLFSAQLFVLIKSKPKQTSIKTFQDLHDSNLPIYTIYPFLSQYLNSFENTTLHRLKDNFKTDKFYEKAFPLDPRFLNITDRALFYPNVIIELIASIPQNKPFLQYFEVMKEPIFQTLLATYLPIGSVYYDHFNNWNLRMVSGGFPLKWVHANRYRLVKHIADWSTSSNNSWRSHQADVDQVPLTYDDLKMAFYILYIGLSVSTLTFLKEVWKL